MIDAKEAAINSSVGLQQNIQKELKEIEDRINKACDIGLTQIGWYPRVLDEVCDIIKEELITLGYTIEPGSPETGYKQIIKW